MGLPISHLIGNPAQNLPLWGFSDRLAHRGILGGIAMFVRLEKVDPAKRQRRFYVIQVARNLFGEWCVIREWGRIGSAGGQSMVNYCENREEAEAHLEDLSHRKSRRGYHVCGQAVF